MTCGSAADGSAICGSVTCGSAGSGSVQWCRAGLGRGSSPSMRRSNQHIAISDPMIVPMPSEAISTKTANVFSTDLTPERNRARRRFPPARPRSAGTASGSPEFTVGRVPHQCRTSTGGALRSEEFGAIAV
ncbi:hypothetical protein GCM10027271_49650 [Saccharopolyspora gloriosae]